MGEGRDNPVITMMGFTSEKELSEMICAVDLTDEMTFHRFEVWKRDDGTRDGLQKVLDKQPEGE